MFLFLAYEFFKTWNYAVDNNTACLPMPRVGRLVRQKSFAENQRRQRATKSVCVKEWKFYIKWPTVIETQQTQPNIYQCQVFV